MNVEYDYSAYDDIVSENEEAITFSAPVNPQKVNAGKPSSLANVGKEDLNEQQEYYGHSDYDDPYVEEYYYESTDAYGYADEWGIPSAFSNTNQLIGVLVGVPLLLICLFLLVITQLFTNTIGTTPVLAVQTRIANALPGNDAAPGAGDYGRSALSAVFRPEVKHWESQILGWATIYKLDPNIIATIMQVESCGDPQAVSSAGAQGLFQVMPFHFEVGEQMLDPDTNAKRGLSYYNERLVQTSGNRALAFAGYNGGHRAAASSYTSWANETQRYYDWTTGIMSDIDAGYTESPTLQRWMTAGGASLCRQSAARLGFSP